jgi:hypothetical protein
MVRAQAPTQAKDRLDRWLATLDAYGVQYLILDTKRDHELVRLVQSNPEWTIDFQEADSILFARTQPHLSARVAVGQNRSPGVLLPARP